MENNIPFNDFLKTEIAKTSAKATLLKFLNYKQTITEEDININWMVRFSEFLDDRNLIANSKRLYLTIMHGVLRKAIRRGYDLKIDLSDSVTETKVKKEASEAVYLDANELKLIELYEPDGIQEEFTKSVFLVCAYTGCRISDSQILSENNIHNSELTYTSEKTKITSRLKAHPSLEKWFKTTKFHKYDEDSVRVIINRDIKEICRKLGIDSMTTVYRRGERVTEPKYMLVTSHTARRSFATNMLLDGYTIEQISKMMGHTTIEMTMRYLCVSHTDRIAGTFSYLNPNKEDELYVRFAAIMKFGLPLDAAKQALMIAGVPSQDVERVANKFNANN